MAFRSSVFDPLQRREEEEEYRRTTLERVFAPVLAPQQATFKLIQSKSDGFQFRDIWDVLSHGANYFNPWSNTEPIDADEIRQTLFGGDPDARGFWRRTGPNLAIDILLDPTNVVALPLRGLGLSARATRNVERVANPALGIAEGLGALNRRVATPVARRTAIGILGEERATRLSVGIRQRLTNKYAGTPVELQEALRRYNAGLGELENEAFSINRRMNELGGRDVGRLMGEALELKAVAYRDDPLAMSKLAEGNVNAYHKLLKRVDAAGIDRDLFLEVFDRARDLDDYIGSQLVKYGAIDPRGEFADLWKSHARRIYLGVESQGEWVERVNSLVSKGIIPKEDTERISVDRLLRSLNKLRSQIDRDPGFRNQGRGQGRLFTPGEGIGAADNPYFLESTGRSRFQSKKFAVDLDTWMKDNSQTSFDQVMTHVRETMLRGAQLPDKFYKSVANHISDSFETVKGSRHYLKPEIMRLMGLQGVGWRTVSERLEVVARREKIPQEIREAMGEVFEAGPRIAEQAKQAGKLLETRKLLDYISGAVRADDETFAKIQQINNLGGAASLNPEARRLIAELSDEYGLNTQAEIQAVLRLAPGGVLNRRGSPIASTSPEGVVGPSIALPDTEAFGSAAGMWVTPGTHNLLNRIEGIGYAQTPDNSYFAKGLELLRQGTGYFKLFKVALDVTAQVRNTLGNAILMDLAGVQTFRVDRMVQAVGELRQLAKTGDPGKYVGLARAAGSDIFYNTFTRAEMDSISRAIGTTPLTRENMVPLLEGVIGAIQGGQISKAVGRVAGSVARTGTKMFDFNERLFKLTTFIDRFEHLKGQLVRRGTQVTPELEIDLAKQAASIAEQALFNYSDVPFWIDTARKYGIVPFITFPFKALPFAARTLYEKPHRVLKYDRIVNNWNDHYAGTPEEAAQEIAALPEHVRKRMVVKLPWDDSRGRAQYVDLSYFLPWQVIMDTKEQVFDPIVSAGSESQEGRDFGELGLRGGILSPPVAVLMSSITRNEDSLGREIVKPGMSNAQKFAALGKFMWQFVLPSSFPGGSRAESIGRAMQAISRSDNQPVDWLNTIGRGARAGFRGPIETSAGFQPQSQSQVGSTALSQLLRLRTGGPASAVLGAGAGLLGGAYASDPAQTAHSLGIRGRLTRTAIQSEIAKIRGDPSLSLQEKNRMIQRLNRMLQESAQDVGTQLRRL